MIRYPIITLKNTPKLVRKEKKSKIYVCIIVIINKNTISKIKSLSNISPLEKKDIRSMVAMGINKIDEEKYGIPELAITSNNRV